LHWQASESQLESSQRAPVDGLAAHAGDGCLATASLSHWHVRRRSGSGCAASAVAPAALQGHTQYAPLQVPGPAAEAGPQSVRRLPLPVFEPPSLLSLRVPPPPVRRRVQPLLGLELDAAAHWQTLRLGTVVQCLRATAARIGCPFAPLYCTGTAGPASPPAPDTGRVASPATEPTPKAPKRKAAEANLTPTGGDIRSFFPKK
jgi:hypothetical protein